ncbi:MAG: hypothetical protein RMM58_15980, partial [Chloroflexota bacterium]|nr:hypothetical protein [Chloroflexota bacterium]
MRTVRFLRMMSGVGALTLLGAPLALAPRDALAQQVVTVQLRPQNNSGQSGTAVLTAQGNRTLVVIQTTGGPGGVQPAHFHRGTCDSLDPAIAVPLTSLQNGRSETIVDVPITTLANGQHSINIHFSPQQPQLYTACGEVAALQAPAPAPPAQPAPPVPPAPMPSPPTPPAPPAATPAPAPAIDVPQFGAANTLAWPPVFSGELQATIG